MKRASLPLALLCLVIVAMGCGGSATRAGSPDGARSCSTAADASGLTPVAPDGRSSSIALGRFADGPLKARTIAFVADEDSRSIAVVNVDARKQIASAALDAVPGQVLLLPDGRLVVALRSANRVTVFHPKPDGSLVRGCDVAVASDPISLALAGDRILVSSGWAHAVEVLALADLSKKATIDVPREPRQIVVSDDGKRAYVAHAIGGKVTVLDLAAMKVTTSIAILTRPDAPDGAQPDAMVNRIANAVERSPDKLVPGKGQVRIGSQGYALAKTKVPPGRLLVPQALVDPGDKDSRPQGIGINTVPAIANVALIDMGTNDLMTGSAQANSPMFFDEGEGRGGRFGQQLDVGTPECLLPRAAVIDDATATLFVACLGIDAVVAYDAASADPVSIEKARWNVASGPTGLAVDPQHSRVIAYSQFERALELLDLRQMANLPSSASDVKHDRIELTALREPLPLPKLLGRQLYFTTGDARISANGLGCASCHPDGRDDGLTWATAEGPRRSKPIAGKFVPPFGWDGESKDLDSHLTREFKRLRGQGLRNVQLEALFAFVTSLPPPPVGAPTEDAALVARGKAVFSSAGAACSSCHAGGESDNKTHDVGSKTSWDRRSAFDTPSLVQVSGRGPYFHDGRFSTLKDLLLEPHRNQAAQRNGAEKPAESMSDPDRAALEAYLRSL